jgi:hypothetical protein
MRSRKFVPGQLVWITQLENGYPEGMIPCRKGYPVRVKLKLGSAATIIRKALAKDYGIYARLTWKGKSQGSRTAEGSWLVLYEGAPMLVPEYDLRGRRYTPRKTKQQV